MQGVDQQGGSEYKARLTLAHAYFELFAHFWCNDVALLNIHFMDTAPKQCHKSGACDANDNLLHSW